MDKLKEWQEKHPELFAEQNCGFGCGQGWYKLLGCIFNRVLSDQKQRIKLKGLQKYEVPDLPFYTFKVEQIKEKFGGLRFYYYTASTEHDWEKFDKEWYDENVVRMKISISGYISAIESVSEFTCEETGDRGTKTSKGWIKTLRPDLH